MIRRTHQCLWLLRVHKMDKLILSIRDSFMPCSIFLNLLARSEKSTESGAKRLVLRPAECSWVPILASLRLSFPSLNSGDSNYSVYITNLQCGSRVIINRKLYCVLQKLGKWQVLWKANNVLWLKLPAVYRIVGWNNN